MESIGLIGKGIVGEAVREGMSHAFPVYWYDKKYNDFPYSISDQYKCNDIGTLLAMVNGPIFLCLPTPMKTDGSCDTSIVESVVEQINNYYRDQNVQRGYSYVTLIIKSTVPPGTTETLNSRYEYVTCVFNPEFLRENSATEDFKNQDRIIIGGPHKAVSIVKQMYQQAYPEVQTTKTSSTIAELVKYLTNCFLATKVAFANEIYQICEKLNVDYDKVIEYATCDKRLGNSHWSVPGHDGHFGFGLTCFPKDLNALIKLAEQLSIDPKVMKAAWAKNLEVRPEKDWEQLKGRAIL